MTVVWILLAALVGLVIGWVLRDRRCRAEHTAFAFAVADEPAPTATAFTAGTHPGSARPLAGGAAPGPEWEIKGNEDAMIYHVPDSSSYARTVAETWFRTEADAVAAGFRAPKNG